MTDRVGRKRVTVTHPMTRAVQSGRSDRTSSVDLRVGVVEVENEDDALVLRSLMQAQLTLALQSFGVLVGALSCVVLGLALLTRLRPSTLETKVFSVPAVWWLLGLLMFPMLYFIAQSYVAQVERLERRFQSLNRDQLKRDQLERDQKAKL